MPHLRKAYIQQGPVGDTVLSDLLGTAGAGQFAPDRDAILVEETFRRRGLETERFIPKQSERAQLALDRSCMVAGDVGCVQRSLRALGVAVPGPDDYPECLRHLLGRRVWPAEMRDAVRLSGDKPVFVKPRRRVKRFTGFVMGDPSDCYAAPHTGLREPVWVSEVVRFLTEYRMFFVRGDCVGTRLVPSTEKFLPSAASPDFTGFLAAVRRHAASLPSAFLLDVGATDDGRTLLVECNDAYSCGAYGLDAETYTEVLATRWSELVFGRSQALDEPQSPS